MLRVLTILAALAGTGSSVACEIALSDRNFERLVAVAFGAEYGGSAGIVVKWESDVRISVEGSPSAADRATVQQVVDELSELIAPTRISLVTANENVRLHFAPESDFETILPQYEPVNMGYFWTWWDNVPSIVQAEVLISTTGLTQRERNHIIREEVTQMLGLMRDIWYDAESIFYSGWTDTERYTESDKRLIGALYCPDVESGMDQAELRAVFAD